MSLTEGLEGKIILYIEEVKYLSTSSIVVSIDASGAEFLISSCLTKSI